jgi:hypothetical protein
VSEGMTNKEVAQRLSLSERTVEGHVASICNKLGFHSRVQIASWVAQAPTTRATGAGLPPLPVLVVMAAGAALPFVAVAYQWSQSRPADVGTATINSLVTAAAVAFVVVPAFSLAGLATGRRWSATVAVVGLVATGSLVLLLAIFDIQLRGNAFRPANWFESGYASLLYPLLVLHTLAGLAFAGRNRAWPWLVSVVAVVWALRYGYGLSLATLVLWLLWSSRKIRLSVRA